MNIIILAAGQGKRMHSSLPKVLHKLAGKPLVSHVIDTAKGLSPKALCVVYGHGGDQVRTTLNDQTLSWALQEPQLGTGHAVQQALPYIEKEGIALVLYGDVPLTRLATLERLVACAKDSLAILTVRLQNPHGYGRIVRDQSGKVTQIVEQKDASAEILKISEINTGIMAMPTNRLGAWLKNLSNNNAQKEYYLTDIVKMAVSEGMSIQTAQPDYEWEVLGVNSKTQLAELERVWQKEKALELMESGVTLADPARFDVRGELVCGQDVYIDINCVFEGSVVLGDGVSVGPNCVLKNAKIGAGTTLAAFTHIDDAKVGEFSQIGPFSRLRPGAELAEKVHIGNFVEIKKSQIAAESKVNHLTYIGDATIGSRVNVGAGTITCNYDGVNKFQTVIEDDAFIGSDTQLVAPVRVGKGATLGAGTTLTKDAAPDTLTVSRAKQISITGWKRPVKIKK